MRFIFGVEADSAEQAAKLIRRQPSRYLLQDPPRAGKKMTLVDIPRLKKALFAAEKDGARPTLVDLYKKAATIYNDDLPSEYPTISYTVVRLRAQSEGLKQHLKTKSARICNTTEKPKAS